MSEMSKSNFPRTDFLMNASNFRKKNSSSFVYVLHKAWDILIKLHWSPRLSPMCIATRTLTAKWECTSAREFFFFNSSPTILRSRCLRCSSLFYCCHPKFLKLSTLLKRPWDRDWSASVWGRVQSFCASSNQYRTLHPWVSSATDYK